MDELVSACIVTRANTRQSWTSFKEKHLSLRDVDEEKVRGLIERSTKESEFRAGLR